MKKKNKKSSIKNSSRGSIIPIIYVRCASKTQDECDDKIYDQIVECKEFVKLRGFNVKKSIILEEHCSGLKPCAERTQLKLILDIIKSLKQKAVVIVTDPSRISRNKKELKNYYNIIKRNGSSIEFTFYYALFGEDALWG